MKRLLAGVFLLILATAARADDAVEKAVEHVIALKGTVTRDEDKPGKPVVRVDLGFTEVMDADLKGLVSLTTLTELNLHKTSVSDDGLKHLAPLTNLTRLDLGDTQVSDEGLKRLAPLKKLTELDLSLTKVTDDGLKHLAPLTKLNYLQLPGIRDQTLVELAKLGLLRALSVAWAGGERPAKPEDVTRLNLLGTGVTNAGLKGLASFKNLEQLALPIRVTDDGLKHLAAFGKLTHLRLYGEGVTDAGLKELSTLKKLVDLNLSDTAVTGTGLADLAALTELTVLDLNDSKVTDEGLKAIAPLTSLTALYLLDTVLTDEGLKHLAPLKKLSRLYLGGSKVTSNGVKHLDPCRNLTYLDLPLLDDQTLVELGKVKLLHALAQAKGDKGRPTKPEEVTQLDLSDTQVTGEGVKALAPLTKLVDLKLPRIDDVTLLELGRLRLLHAVIRGFDAEQQLTGNPDHLTWLDLSATKVTAKGIKALKLFKKLTYLSLPQVDDDTLIEVGKTGLLHALPQATTADGGRPTGPDEVALLDLQNTDVTADGLKALAPLKNLTALRLAEIDDKTLVELGNIKRLHALSVAQVAEGDTTAKPEDVIGFDFSGTKVTAQGLKALKPFPKLTTLELPRIDDAVLVELGKIGLLHALPAARTKDGERPGKAADVTELDLIFADVTNKGLKELAPFTDLDTLVLTGMGVTDEGLNNLKAFKKLTKLTLIDTGVTEGGVEKLKKALPKCEVSR